MYATATQSTCPYCSHGRFRRLRRNKYKCKKCRREWSPRTQKLATEADELDIVLCRFPLLHRSANPSDSLEGIQLRHCKSRKVTKTEDLSKVPPQFVVEKGSLVVTHILYQNLLRVLYLNYCFHFLPHITNPYQLIYPQIAEGIALGLIVPAFQGLYSSTLELGKHTSSWGDYIGAANIAAAIALFFSGFIAQRLGYTTLFYTIAGFQACTVIGSLLLFKLKPKTIE